jgi:hypothetical protein
MPVTDLKITPAGNGGKSTYDALATCSKGGWGAPTPPTCSGTVGGYLLDKISVAVPGQKRGAAHTAKVTLLERDARGKFVPVASTVIRLPADTAANNRRAPIISVPDLTAVAHVP